jgi:hypothetical protein
MSDLGPFVAAHLRDKIIADLLEENKQLKTQLNNARRISITGPGGSPVYVEEDFSNGRYDALVMPGEWWQVPFAKQPGQVPELCCTLSILQTCEVRIGNFVRIKVEDFDHLCISNYDRELSMVKVKYCSVDPCLEVGVHIPMDEQLFQSLHARTQRLERGAAFFMDLIPTDHDLPVIFEDLLFHADSARQALVDFGIDNVEWLDSGSNNDASSSSDSLSKNCSRNAKSTT